MARERGRRRTGGGPVCRPAASYRGDARRRKPRRAGRRDAARGPPPKDEAEQLPIAVDDARIAGLGFNITSDRRRVSATTIY